MGAGSGEAFRLADGMRLIGQVWLLHSVKAKWGLNVPSTLKCAIGQSFGDVGQTSSLASFCIRRSKESGSETPKSLPLLLSLPRAAEVRQSQLLGSLSSDAPSRVWGDLGCAKNRLASMTTAQLTFLSFIGATSVVIFHFGRSAGSLAWANALWDRANAAVPFFFVMSGFILTHVYGAKGIRRATDFYVARIARILPVYWIALALVVLYEPRQQPPTTWWVWLSASLLQSWWIGYSQILNVPGWSLSAELFFYLLFPFLLRTMSRLRTRTVLVVAGSAWVGNVALNVVLIP